MAYGPPGRTKIVLLGDSGVGKSSILYRLKVGAFLEKRVPTQFYDHCSMVVCARGAKHPMTVWDTAGMERYRTLTRSYFNMAHAILLVYSLDNPISLEHLSSWKTDAMKFIDDGVMWVLVGNKTDLQSVISPDSIHDFFLANQCDYACKMSAKTGHGVEEALETIAIQITKQKHQTALNQRGNSMDEPPPDVVHVDEVVSKQQSCCK